MIDDASDGSTRDSGKDSYNSSWTSRLADFQVEIDIPKEVLHSFQPNPRVPAQSDPTKDSYAQVASRAASASTASPHVTPPPIPSPPDLTTVQTPVFVLHLQQEMANMEARIAAKIEAQQTELQATAPTPTVQQESAFPPPAPDPQSDQLDSILSFLTQQMSNMESRLTATFGAQLQAQSQQIASLTHQLGNGQSKHPQQSPQRKRSKTNVKTPASSPSSRPDGASDQEDNMDETTE
jgi:hypothetical protein